MSAALCYAVLPMTSAQLQPITLVSGDRVLYTGPTEGEYFPAQVVGTITGPVHGRRVWVRYPWGVQYLRVDCLEKTDR
jgi:hypothetical protein